jgi:hypothetical protein
MDALSNSVALLEFAEPTTELVVTFKFRGEHYGVSHRGVFRRSAGQEFPVNTPLTNGTIWPRSCGRTRKIWTAAYPPGPGAS